MARITKALFLFLGTSVEGLRMEVDRFKSLYIQWDASTWGMEEAVNQRPKTFVIEGMSAFTGPGGLAELFSKSAEPCIGKLDSESHLEDALSLEDVAQNSKIVVYTSHSSAGDKERKIESWGFSFDVFLIEAEEDLQRALQGDTNFGPSAVRVQGFRPEETALADKIIDKDCLEAGLSDKAMANRVWRNWLRDAYQECALFARNLVRDHFQSALANLNMDRYHLLAQSKADKSAGKIPPLLTPEFSDLLPIIDDYLGVDVDAAYELFLTSEIPEVVDFRNAWSISEDACGQENEEKPETQHPKAPSTAQQRAIRGLRELLRKRQEREGQQKKSENSRA
jgi:hypothetical protein